MTSEERRKILLQKIQDSATPLSGTVLAKELGISRQVVVQDITILRASGFSIEATPKGYIFDSSSKGFIRVFEVTHSDADTEDELNSIVDLGGTILDVIVMHDVYGALKGSLHISCRRHVKEFIEKINNSKSMPLKNLSSGSVHFHTVLADSEETLDLIEDALKAKGYLV